MNKNYLVPGIVSLLLLYLLKPYYDQGKLFMGLPSILWLIIPFLVGSMVYYVTQKTTWIEKLQGLTGEDKEKELEDPFVILQKYENSNDRILAPSKMRFLGYQTRINNEWIYPFIVNGQKAYLVLNGIPNAKLNPLLIRQRDISSLGFDNLVDMRKNEKSRNLIDMIKAGLSLDEVKDMGGKENEI